MSTIRFSEVKFFNGVGAATDLFSNSGASITAIQSGANHSTWGGQEIYPHNPTDRELVLDIRVTGFQTGVTDVLRITYNQAGKTAIVLDYPLPSCNPVNPGYQPLGESLDAFLQDRVYIMTGGYLPTTWLNSPMTAKLEILGNPQCFQVPSGPQAGQLMASNTYPFTLV